MLTFLAFFFLVIILILLTILQFSLFFESLLVELAKNPELAKEPFVECLVLLAIISILVLLFTFTVLLSLLVIAIH